MVPGRADVSPTAAGNVHCKRRYLVWLDLGNLPGLDLCRAHGPFGRTDDSLGGGDVSCRQSSHIEWLSLKTAGTGGDG
jgi:hypothetical protein